MIEGSDRMEAEDVGYNLFPLVGCLCRSQSRGFQLLRDAVWLTAAAAAAVGRSVVDGSADAHVVLKGLRVIAKLPC
jgi:hypothetical protein